MQDAEDPYTRALDGADPLASLREAPARVRRLLRGLDARALARRPGRGRWSIREVLAHLADHEVVFGARVRMVASHDRPALQAYDQGRFMRHLPRKGVPAADLWADWAAARAANTRLLEGLPKRAFARVGVHAERGEETLRRVVVMGAGHDRIHEAQIRRMLPRKA